jgi:hypothetical protein
MDIIQTVFEINNNQGFSQKTTPQNILIFPMFLSFLFCDI